MSNPRFNYDALRTYILGGRSKRDRPLKSACLRAHLYGDEPVVRMYSTDIARFHSDGTITVSAGNWGTSSTTRNNIGEVTGLSLFSLSGTLKRQVAATTRAYAGYRFPHGLPFEDGIKVKHGTVVWHPEMERQGVSDIHLMREAVEVEDKEKSRPYREARRALLRRLRPFKHFISDESLNQFVTPHRPTAWFEGVLDDTTDDELYGVACQLCLLGMPAQRGYRWGRAQPTLNADTIDQYIQRGIAACVGASSWLYLKVNDMTKTEMVLCTEV